MNGDQLEKKYRIGMHVGLSYLESQRMIWIVAAHQSKKLGFYNHAENFLHDKKVVQFKIRIGDLQMVSRVQILVPAERWQHFAHHCSVVDDFWIIRDSS